MRRCISRQSAIGGTQPLAVRIASCSSEMFTLCHRRAKVVPKQPLLEQSGERNNNKRQYLIVIFTMKFYDGEPLLPERCSMNKLPLRVAAGALWLAVSSASMADSSITMPIEINGVMTETPGPSLRCPSKFGGVTIGRGEGALTGPVAFIANDCITQSGTLFTFSAGKLIVLTVAGDQIFADYSGQFVPTGVGSNFVFSGATFQVTGGTGKFSRASGGGNMTGAEDISTGEGTIKLSGHITYKDKS